MAERIATHMATNHTKFIRGAVPIQLEKPDPNGKIKVTWKNNDGS